MVSHYPWRVTGISRSHVILTADTNKGNRIASARAFVHSLNILVKYVRLYGLEHKRTEGQLTITWTELQEGLPQGTDGSFLLGVSENKLLLDGTPLETGQAERSFAQLLTTAGLASIHFSNQIRKDEFLQLVRAFAMGGSRAQDVIKEIKSTFGDSKTASIRINEVRFVAADPSTGEFSIAAQIAAQTLGPEFKQWLNDPQKLLQLIAAAEGAKSGGGGPGGGPVGSVPNVGPAVEGGVQVTGGGTWAGSVVPLQEEEVIQTIRLLTRFGEVGGDPGADTTALQKELTTVDANTKDNLQHLLGSLAAQVNVNTEQTDNTPLLMKAAEHMAIRFALER